MAYSSVFLYFYFYTFFPVPYQCRWLASNSRMSFLCCLCCCLLLALFVFFIIVFRLSHILLSLQQTLFTPEYLLVNLSAWLQNIKLSEPKFHNSSSNSSCLKVHKGIITKEAFYTEAYMTLTKKQANNITLK